MIWIGFVDKLWINMECWLYIGNDSDIILKNKMLLPAVTNLIKQFPAIYKCITFAIWGQSDGNHITFFYISDNKLKNQKFTANFSTNCTQCLINYFRNILGQISKSILKKLFCLNLLYHISIGSIKRTLISRQYIREFISVKKFRQYFYKRMFYRKNRFEHSENKRNPAIHKDIHM